MARASATAQQKQAGRLITSLLSFTALHVENDFIFLKLGNRECLAVFGPILKEPHNLIWRTFHILSVFLTAHSMGLAHSGGSIHFFSWIQKKKKTSFSPST